MLAPSPHCSLRMAKGSVGHVADCALCYLSIYQVAKAQLGPCALSISRQTGPLAVKGLLPVENMERVTKVLITVQ